MTWAMDAGPTFHASRNDEEVEIETSKYRAEFDAPRAGVVKARPDNVEGIDTRSSVIGNARFDGLQRK